MARSGASWALLPFVAQILTSLMLSKFYAGSHSCHEFMRAIPVSCTKDKFSQHFPPSCCSYCYFQPSSTVSLWALGEEVLIWMYPLGRNSHSHLFLVPWPVMNLCIFNHCRKKLVWPRLRTAKICEYKYKYSKDTLTVWSFSNTTTAGSPLGHMISHPLALGRIYNTSNGFPPVKWVPNAIRRALATL